MDSLKILVLSRGVSRKNGGSSSILDIFLEISAMGYESYMATPFGILDYLLYSCSDFFRVKRALMVCPLSKIDNAYARYSKPKLIASQAVSSLFIVTSLEKLDEYGVLIDDLGLKKEELAKFRGVKIFNHAGSPKQLIDGLGGSVETYLDTMSRYDYVLFQSKNQLMEFNEIIPSSKTLLLRPSVDEDAIARSINKKIDNSGSSDVTVRCICVGSIQLRKNQKALLNVIKLLNESFLESFELLLVGPISDKKYFDEINQEIAQSNLQAKVKVLGYRSDYLDLMQASDVVVQVSLEEGVSRAIREALALGKSIVSYNLSGVTDFLIDGVNCELVVNRNPITTANAIYRAFVNKDAYGNESRMIYEREFSKTMYRKNLEKMMREL